MVTSNRNCHRLVQLVARSSTQYNFYSRFQQYFKLSLILIPKFLQDTQYRLDYLVKFRLIYIKRI